MNYPSRLTFLLIFLAGLFFYGCNEHSEQSANHVSANAVAQTETNGSNDNENARAKQDSKKHYHFTEMWVWKYTNYDGEQGEMGVYHEPASGAWLFTQDAYGDTDPMSDWILGLPDGRYLLGYIDPEFGSKKQVLEMKASFGQFDELRELWTKTTKTAVFADNPNSREKFSGIAYDVRYPKTNDRSRVFVADTKIDFRPVYYFNTLDTDARLPIEFPVALRKGEFALADSTVLGDGTKVSFTFTELSPNDYHVHLDDYGR